MEVLYPNYSRDISCDFALRTVEIVYTDRLSHCILTYDRWLPFFKYNFKRFQPVLWALHKPTVQLVPRPHSDWPVGAAVRSHWSAVVPVLQQWAWRGLRQWRWAGLVQWLAGGVGSGCWLAVAAAVDVLLCIYTRRVARGVTYVAPQPSCPCLPALPLARTIWFHSGYLLRAAGRR